MISSSPVPPVRPLVGFALSILLIAGLALLAPPTGQASYPGTNGRIAFSEISLDATSPTTGGRIKLVDGGSDGDYSADGSRIVYLAAGGVFIANNDGSNPVQLYTNTSDNRAQHPVLSPNGTRIAFSVYHPFSATEDIRTMLINGTGITGIAPGNPISGRVRFPEFSPDGSKVVYSDTIGANRYAILEAPIDGSNSTTLAAPVSGSHRSYYAPDYSPDGSTVVFHADQQDTNDLFVLDSQLFSVPAGAANGTPTARSAAGGSWEFSAAYSPDGAKLTFANGTDAAGYSLVTRPFGGGSLTSLLPLEYINPQATYDFAADWGSDTSAVPITPGDPVDPDPVDPDPVDPENPSPQCSDGLDNDGDGDVDFPADTGCSSPDDDDESGGKPGGGNGSVDSDVTIVRKQRGTSVKIILGCPLACTGSATGSATIRTGKKRARIPMKAKPKSLGAGQVSKLVLKPKGRKNRKKLAKALKRRQKVRVAVIVKIRESDGDSKSFKRVVTLKK